MTLWFVLAIMTAAAIFAVLWPLSRRAPQREGTDVAVYRDQLEEIERDRAAGLIGEREAEAARVEVSRRLIAAADAPAPAATPVSGDLRRRTAAIVGLVLLPLGAAGLYLLLGAPQLPGQPLASRFDATPEHRSIAELVVRVEAHLEQNPDDGRGWEVVGPVYMRMGRFEDAIKARQHALRLLGATADREADLGEAFTGLANGVVTTEAKAAFERAVALDPEKFKARFFLGLAAEQDGRPEEAARQWRALVAASPPGAPWLGLLRESLARVDPDAARAAPGPTAPDVAAPRAPGPSAEDMAAAGALSPEQRDEMVRGMVARLADRLTREGSDVDGWLRLVRAYMVLGERDKALGAASDARRALASEPEKLRRVDELVKGLGLEG
jgi:cytochrome c-type biogenesis protein CcmH